MDDEANAALEQIDSDSRQADEAENYDHRLEMLADAKGNS